MSSTQESSQPIDRFSSLDLDKIKDELESNGKIECPTPNCNEIFKSIWGLKFHLKKNSCSAPRFKCDKCAGAFQSRILLQQHVCEDTTDKSMLKEDNIEKSSDKQEILTPGAKGDNKITFSPINTNVKTEPSKSVANNLEILTPNKKPGRSSKQKDNIPIISKENPTKSSSKFGEDSLVKDWEQTCQEVLVEREEICTTTVDPIKTPKRMENSSQIQENTTIKRKRGRPPKSEVSAQVESNSNSSNVESAHQEKSYSATKKDSKMSRQIKAPSSEQDLTSPKRKRGRPRKTESPGDKTSEVRIRKNSSELNKDLKISSETSARQEGMNENCSVTNDRKATLNDVATPKRKRGRPPKAKTTPRESVNSGDPSVQMSGVKSVKKRGRPRKNTSDSPSDNNEVPKRSSGRSVSKKVINYAEKEDGDASDDDSISDDGDDIDNDDDDDGDGASKKPKLDASNDGDAADDDDYDGDDDGGVNVKTPKSKKKNKEMTEKQKLMASLKKQLKTGKVSCTNNCGKKFASIAGLNFHLEICGKERSKINCEICGKEYTTQAGLKYHMNAIHPETEDEAEEKEDEDTNEETEVPDGIEDESKRPRRAASRAIKKFREIEKVQKKIEIPKKKSTYGSRSSLLDQHLKKVREDIITPALISTVKKQLRKNKETVCPNEGCQRPFTTFTAFKSHYLQCGFDSSPFGCLLCGQGYNSIDGARMHVERFHGIDVDNDSRKDGEDSGSEQEDSDKGSDSDVDYKKGTDEESDEEEEEEEDDDYDVIEEDESDNALSDGEDHDDTKKGLQWDERRKRYKVEMRTKASRKSDMMLFVGRWNKTFRQFEKWRKENFSKKEFFTEHVPTLDHWSKVQTSDVSVYMPTSTQSPHFRIVRPNIEHHKNTLDTHLPVFTGLPKDDSGVHGDRIFYTGGPVWELSWCPTPDGKQNVNQYLIASAHSSFEKVHNAYEYHKGKGLLQVWNLGTLSNTSSSSGEGPTLALAIAHNFGPVWRISWCPNGVWQPPLLADIKEKKLSVLGLMALACGDGIVRVISLPHPEELLSKLTDSSNVEANETEQSSSVDKVLVHCVPNMELYPCPLNSTYNGRRGQALCVDWSVVEPYDKVAAGYSDGTVVVWNLLTESPLLRKPTGKAQATSRLAPIMFIKAHSSMIRDLAFCPGNVDFLATGGHDRNYKIWDLKSPISPVFVCKKGFPYEVEWPFYANGFMYCEDVMYFKDEPSVRLFNMAEKTPSPRAFLKFPSSTYTLSYNSWINVLASADVGGNVMLAKMISSGQEIWHLYKTNLEDLNASSETPASTDDAASKLKEKSRGLKEETSTSRIVFQDINALQFQFLVSKKNNKELEEKPDPILHNCSTLQAVHKVRWNPNKQALTWIATGGASGLVRIHHVRQVEPHHLKSAS